MSSPVAAPQERFLRALTGGLILASFLAGAGAIAVAFASPLMIVTGVACGLAYLLRLLRGGNLLPGALAVEAGLAGVGVVLGLVVGQAQQDLAPGLAMFLLVAQAIKLVAPRWPRDEGTACVVGIVLGGVAAAEAVELSFGVVFGACVVLGGLAAMARSTLGQIEAARLRQTQAPVVLGSPLGLRTSVVQLALLLFALLLAGGLFLLIPRVGAKWLPRHRRTNQRLSGFSEIVGLEDIGRIKQSREVALRVELLDGLRPPGSGEFYLRGAALDTYEGSSWQTTDVLMRRRELRDLSYLGTLGLDDRRVSGQDPDQAAVVYLEPIGTRVLFTLGTTKQLHFKNRRPRSIRRDAHGSWRSRRVYRASQAYRVAFKGWGSPRIYLEPQLDDFVRRRCEAVPADLAAFLSGYADAALERARVAGDAPAATRARVLSDHLSQNLEYTALNTRDPDVDPVEDFLTRSQAGHCELFASSLALLLRSQRIPSRVVTGYRGGEWNDWTSTITIRQSNAHAWVEAYLGEDAGWVRLDPTPADPNEVEEGGVVAAFGSLIDWIELRWFQYVIAYDAYDQRAAWTRVVSWIQDRLSGSSPAARLLWAAAAGVLLLGLALVLLRGLWLLLWRLRREPGPAAYQPGPELARLLRALAERGLERAPGETPLELVRRARPQLGPELARALEPALGALNAERFGGKPLDPVPLRAALSRLRQG